MRMYDVMLFLALFGAVTGAISEMAGDEWFPDYASPDMESVEVDTDVRYEKPNMSSSFTESSNTNPFSVLSILWGVIQGIFGLGFILNDIFPVYNDAGTNVALPIYAIIQVGIWVIYAIGFLQILSGRSVKGME